MIYGRLWRGITPGSREFWTQEWTPGMTAANAVPDWPERGAVLLNGKACERGDRVSRHDQLDVIPFPGGTESVLLNFIIKLAVAVAVSYAIRAILPDQKPAVERGDERSPTHGFSRLANIRAEGQPIQVIYGEHLVAGTIINEFVEVNNTSGESTYFALCDVGHGPIEAISDQTEDTPDVEPLTSVEDTAPQKIYLQANSISNYSGVRAWVRLGSFEQKFVPGFEKAKETYEVGVTLTNDPVGGGTDSIPQLDFGSDDYEEVWEEFGYAWDAVEEDVDGVEVVLNFPQGLYRVQPATGNIMPGRFVLGIRYCKLDSNGNPLLGPGLGGNQDDGWVRLPFELFNLDRQSAFQLGFQVPFFDPTDFIDALPGDSFNITSWVAGEDYLATDSLTATELPNTWVGVVPSFTFECWVAFDAGVDADEGPFDSDSFGGYRFVPLFEWSTDGLENGVWCGFRVRGGSGVGVPAGGWEPWIQVGKDSRFHVWPVVYLPGTLSLLKATTSSDDKQWNHIVFTKFRGSSSSDLYACYVNGVFLGNRFGNVDIIVPPQTYFRLGTSDHIQVADYAVRGWWDEVAVLDTFYSHQDVLVRYNGGIGQRYTDNPNAVGIWHMDGGLTDSTGFGNDLGLVAASGSTSAIEVHNPAVPGSGGIITVFVSPSGTRGRYRIQALRVNGEPVEGVAGAERVQDVCEFQLAVTWIEQAFVYPGIAYSALEVPATEQLNTSAPTITQVVKGRKVRIWDGESTIAPSFSRAWTRNTAWIAMDIATDEEYGGGQAFKIENMDLPSVKELAERCEERVYDGRGKRYFYRQEYEASANKCQSPVTIDAFWSLLGGGGPTITQNVAVAPNGNLEADRVEDTSNTQTETIGFTAANLSPQADWYVISAYVAKDVTATTSTSGLRIFWAGFPADGPDTVGTKSVAFNLDNGNAVFGCSVVDYNDDWWWVKSDPFYYNGVGSINCYYYPHAWDRGGWGTFTDVANMGAMDVWGFSIHRGKTHIPYPDIETARAYFYMANEDTAGDPQTLPSHWIAGYDLAVTDANDPNWKTPERLQKSLEIEEVNQLDIVDGYDRVWQIVCKWPSAIDAPGSTFPNLVKDGADWLDISTNWNAYTGVTESAEFDDGDQTGGPEDEDPRNSTVAKVVASIAFNGNLIDQDLPASPLGDGPSNRIVARAHIYSPAGDAIELFTYNGTQTITAAGTSGSWAKVSLVHSSPTSTTSIGLTTGNPLIGTEIYMDGVGCWEALTNSGAIVGGTIGGSEPLFQYDASHDTFKDLWETLIDVLLTARAMPVREGSRLRFKYEAPRDPVGLITMGNVVNVDGDSTFSMRYVNEKERANSLSIDFHDRDKQWERSVAQIDSPEIATAVDEGLIRKEQFFLLGVTRRSQVLRHGLYQLAVYRTLIREGSYVSDPTAITYEPGDVVAIGHDLMPWGQGGRLTRSSGSGPNEIIPDESEDFSTWTVPSGEIILTADSMSTPDGRPVADMVETIVASQTSLSMVFSSIVSGVTYSFSIRVKRLVGTEFGIALQQPSTGGAPQILGKLDWATGSFTEHTATGGNVTVEEEADGWYRVGIDMEADNSGDITALIVPERDSSSLLGTKIWIADAQFEVGTGGIASTYDRPGTGLWIDRTVTLAAGETYNVRVVSVETGETSTGTIISPAGEYVLGDLLEVSGLTLTPQEGDTYLLYTDAQRFLAMVSAIRINEDLSCEVDWVQFDESIFDGDDVDDTLFVETEPPGTGGSPTGNPDRATLVPNDMLHAEVLEMNISDPSGSHGQGFEVSWELDPETAADVKEVNVYVSFLDDNSPTWTQPRHVGTASGSAINFRAQLPQWEKGRLCFVRLQPVSYGGAKRSPRMCGGQVIELGNYQPKPGTPTDFVAHMEGDEIAFQWTPPETNNGLIYEIRHGGASPDGGWVLAQLVGTTRETKLVTNWWATANQAVTYYLRAKNGHGVYSDPATIVYGARVLNATILNSSNHFFRFVTQEWHNYADGWKTDSAAPTYDPTLTGLTRHADGYLEFSSSILSGTYVTADVPAIDAPDHFQNEERMYVEAVLVATCDNPDVIGDTRYNADGTVKYRFAQRKKQIGFPYRGNETLEGNLQEELPKVKVQMKLLRKSASGPFVSTDVDSDGSSGWLDYRPGIYPCYGAQFRLLATRPTDDWNVRIWRFTVQCSRALPERHYRTPLERSIAQRLGHG